MGSIRGKWTDDLMDYGVLQSSALAYGGALAGGRVARRVLLNLSPPTPTITTTCKPPRSSNDRTTLVLLLELLRLLLVAMIAGVD